MKKIYVLLTSMFLLALGACEKDLQQTPITSKDLNNFLRTETEVEEYVNAVYANLQLDGLYGLYLPAFGEIPSDNTFDEVPANDDGIYGQLDEFSTLPSNGIVTATWRDSYKGIQTTNVVLNRIDAVSYRDDKVKQARKGEMKFIRALLYFNLVRLYGDVPLAIQETTDPNAYFGKGRQPVGQVYDQIRQDLTEAIEALPTTASQPGKVIKTAAQALLGKVYLTLNRFAEAKPLLLSVVNSGKHSLLTKPQDVFSINNENNAEIIFAVQFASGINGNAEGSLMFQQFSPSGTQTGAKGHNLPTKSLYSLYEANDLRKDTYVTTTVAGIPFSKKLTKPTTIITDGGSDFIVLRYADVLLMLAEVENELENTPTAVSQAATYLDQVRNRAGLAKSSATNQADMRKAIALERKLELVGEGQGWFDLLRTGTAIEVMNAWFKANGKSTFLDSHHLLMPVPQSQINTDPAIKQNKGY